MATNNPRYIKSLLAAMAPHPDVPNDIVAKGISLDSRTVQIGWLFLALAADSDARLKHLRQALAQGAVVVLFDSAKPLTKNEKTALQQAGVCGYAITGLSAKAGEIAARFYNHPSLSLTVIAITGTNGKTSVSHFIAQALAALDLPCGVIGTAGVGIIDNLQQSGMTTPDPVSLQAMLADFYHQSIKYVVIEASSHALDQGRLNSVAIDVATLTNLSRDHLNYHQGMAEYAAAKQQLFDFDSIQAAVINSSDDFGQILIAYLKNRADLSVSTYSSQSDATMYATDIASSIDGLSFKVSNHSQRTVITSPLIGRFNVDNLLAAASSLLAIGICFDDVVKSIQHCHAVAGRMEIYGTASQARVVIDFAHTADALTQSLQSLRLYLPVGGRLWCVFGCGGDRDAGKRPLMGHSAELYADNIVLTDDNPRSEPSNDIIDDILSGLEQPEQPYIESDRMLAITHAISSSTAGDIILVAGKGAEQYQEIAGVKYPVNDAQVVIKALQATDDEANLIVSAN